MLTRMQWCHAILLVVAATVAALPPATAQLFEIPETYSGDLGSRVRLTGDWGGVRNDLAKRGVVLDVDLQQTLQSVVDGGRKTGTEYFGSADYTLNVDTGKLGLWPGGFLKVFAESSFGKSVNQDAGAIIPVNADTLFPVPDEDETTLTSVVITQFLSPWFGVFLGKLETLGGDANEFAHDHKTQFLNTAFAFNLATLRTVPYSALGGGIILVPFKDALLTATVLDPNGKANESGFGDFFEDGVTAAVEFRAPVKPFGLPGHQLVGFTYSNKDFVSLEQDPRFLLGRLIVERFPALGVLIPAGDIKRESGSWSVYYNFDQYLWTNETDPSRGVGIFFRFGVSDGEANPIKYHTSAGIGGKGAIPGRPRDTFGIGWSYIKFSDELLPNLRSQFDLGLEHEQVVELYYNVAVTPWLFVTPDLQIVQSGLNKFLDPPGPPLKEMDTAIVLGLRVYARF